MTENQEVLKERLQQLLNQKKSRKYYAKRLGVSESDVKSMLAEIRGEVTQLEDYVTQLEDTVILFEEDLINSKAQLTAKLKDEIKTLEELIQKCNIDTAKWNIDRYVQNYWGNQKDPHWQVKAYLSLKKESDNFQKNFIDFLSNYKVKVLYPIPPTIQAPVIADYEKACLIINKQDEHLNKFDNGGDNDIDKRFKNNYNKLSNILIQSSLHADLEKIVYVVGSDQFNSEWTGATVRGTPQTNILPYQEGFERVCNYELSMIELLRAFCDKLEIIYVSGNHDEYVGWHLIQWLKACYRDNKNINIDTSVRYRKYIRYGNSAIMFNHGDAIKPPKLASMFPIEFRDQWSRCDNYYIFTGDKHHELSLDFNGITFYQLPALSKAKSSWDDKQGHTCSKAELTGFLIEEKRGITNIYKQQL